MASFKPTRLITAQWKLYSEHEREFISRRNNADKCDLFLARTRSDARNFYVTIKISWQVSMFVTGCTQARVIYRPTTMDLSCVIYRAGTRRRCGTVSSSTMAGAQSMLHKRVSPCFRETRTYRARAPEETWKPFLLIHYLLFTRRPLSRVRITIRFLRKQPYH